MYLYDYKFPDLSEIAYNHLINHLDGYKVKPKFYIINFDDHTQIPYNSCQQDDGTFYKKVALFGNPTSIQI